MWSSEPHKGAGSSTFSYSKTLRNGPVPGMQPEASQSDAVKHSTN